MRCAQAVRTLLDNEPQVAERRECSRELGVSVAAFESVEGSLDAAERRGQEVALER